MYICPILCISAVLVMHYYNHLLFYLLVITVVTKFIFVVIWCQTTDNGQKFSEKQKV